MKDIITVSEGMSIIEEVWRKYKGYTPKWKAQRIIYICNKKFNKYLNARSPKNFKHYNYKSLVTFSDAEDFI